MGKISKSEQQKFKKDAEKHLGTDTQSDIKSIINDNTAGLANIIKVICKNCGSTKEFNVGDYTKKTSQRLDTSKWKNKSYLGGAFNKIINVGDNYAQSLEKFKNVGERLNNHEKKHWRSKSKDAADKMTAVFGKCKTLLQPAGDEQIKKDSKNLYKLIDGALKKINSLNRGFLFFQRESGLWFLKYELLEIMYLYKNCVIPISEFYRKKDNVKNQLYCMDENDEEIKGFSLEKFENVTSSGNIFVIETGEGKTYKNGIVDEDLLKGISKIYGEKKIGIIDAANTGGVGGGGIDGVIFGKMGYRDAVNAIRDQFGEGKDLIEEGGAIAHSSFGIKKDDNNVVTVIQAVGPVVSGKTDIPKLYSAYENAIKLGEAKSCDVLLTGAISMGAFWTVTGEESKNLQEICAHMVCDIANKYHNMTIIFIDHFPRRGHGSDVFMAKLKEIAKLID